MKKNIILILLLISSLIRLIGLNVVPPSPYWEEAALGYEAYSLLKTGRDHHGAAWPIVAFESFGDYKPTFYAYTIIPFITIFNLSVTAVRMPSVVSGIVIVVMIGLIIRELTDKSKKHRSFANHWLLSGLLVATFSPWLILFSRGGWESNLATALLTSGVWTGLVAKKQTTAKNWLLWMSATATLLILALYTYHSARIIAPILGICLAVWQFQGQFNNLKKLWRPTILIAIWSVLLLSPFIRSLSSTEVTQRWQETSLLTDPSIIEASNRYQQFYDFHPLARVVFHRYWFYAGAVLENGLLHASPAYLFLTGDTNLRHSTGWTGIFYPLDALLLLVGLITIWNKQKKLTMFLLFWIVLAIFPASLTRAAPHALRTLAAAPPLLIITGAGLARIILYLRSQFKFLPITSIVISAYLLQVGFFLIILFKIFPATAASEWQYGYQQLVSAIHTHQQTNEPVTITREQGRPAMYYWFYSKTDPHLVQQADREVARDQGEYLEFQNMSFPRGLTGEETGLIASSPHEADKILDKQVLTEVRNLKGEVVWVVFRK